MMAVRRLLHPWPVLVILVCAALPASPAAAANWKFRADEQARIEVNEDAKTDARVLATDAPGIYLVELPFESKYVLVDVPSRSAILLMRNEVKRVKSEGRGDAILIDQRSGLGTPSHSLRSDGQAFDFQTDISSVHVDLPRPKSESEGGGAAKKEVAPAKPGPQTPAPQARRSRLRLRSQGRRRSPTVPRRARACDSRRSRRCSPPAARSRSTPGTRATDRWSRWSS